MAAAKRTRALLALADAIEANADELAELESLDNGKPVKLAKRVDVRARRRAPALLRRLADKIEGETLPVAQANMHCYTRKEPVGVVRPDHPVELPAADGGLEDRRRRWPPAARSSSSRPSRRR